MNKLLAIVLLVSLHQARAEDLIEYFTIDGSSEKVEFINGYNLKRCIAIDRRYHKIVNLDADECNELREPNSKKAPDLVEYFTIGNSSERVEFVNGYNLQRCISIDRANNEFSRLDSDECNKLREANSKKLVRKAIDSETEEIKLRKKAEQEREQRDQAYQQQYQKERDRIAQLNACEATQPYLLYAAQEAVIEDVETQQNLKKAVAYQKKLIQMSGVRNLSEEREIAVEQLEVQAALKEHWAEYKSAGGKAASPQAVKHKVEDPCDSFRPES